MAEGVPNPRVLVVDDEPNLRELVQVALSCHGCAVTTGATGAGALQLAQACEPDLIVLDVLLPDTVTGLTIGGDDYITKPFSVEALVARVRAVPRQTAGHRERAAGTPGDGSEPDGGTPATLRVADLELGYARQSQVLETT